jgi:curli production assembly/transport component CsgF
MKISTACCIAVLTAVTGGSAALATELVYAPVNPSFGGNPLNGSYLMSIAGAQNKFKEKTATNSLDTQDSLSTFKRQLENRILNSIANRIVTDAFGDEGLTDGEYIVNNLKVNINASDPTVTVMTITDMDNGNTTTIQIPTL